MIGDPAVEVTCDAECCLGSTEVYLHSMPGPKLWSWEGHEEVLRGRGWQVVDRGVAQAPLHYCPVHQTGDGPAWKGEFTRGRQGDSNRSDADRRAFRWPRRSYDDRPERVKGVTER